jgi:site-specific DNA-methyltransferase (adenine-specific)
MKRFIQGDCVEVIKTLEEDSIDFIYSNPPYGITHNVWDTPLDWEELWKDIWRVLKPTGVALFHSSMPFTYNLVNTQQPKYHYIWVKNNSTGFLTAKKQPLRITEEVLVFYKKTPITYNPQMIGDKIYKTRSAGKRSQDYWGTNISDSHKPKKVVERKGKYPTNLLKYPLQLGGGWGTISSDMIEFFIKTYTNEGDTYLDLTCHNTFVGNIATKLNRNYIGIDINPIIDVE